MKKKPADKLRLAGYCRISVDVEADRENTSIENQKAIIADYAAAHFPGAPLTFFADRDRSGYTFEQREAYQLMRPRLMAGEYDVLIVKDLSRFSRRNSRGLVELEDLRDAGVRIIAIGDQVDYPTKDDWTNIRLRFLLNEMPVTDSSQKVKSVISRRQKDGKWICAVPYGYVITNPKTMQYRVDQAAAEVVRLVFSLYLDGWGYKRIANHLTALGLPTPRMEENRRAQERGEQPKRKARSEWSIATIQGMLQNDFYQGTLRQGKYRRKAINGKDIKADEAEHILFENHHPAIIDPKTFLAAKQQMELRTRSPYRGGRKYNNPYSGILFCGDCGSPMFAMSRPDLAPAYTCGRYHRRGRKGCTSHHTRVDWLDGLLKEFLEKVRENGHEVLKALEEALEGEKKGIEEADGHIALQTRLEQSREELKQLMRQKLRELTRRPGEEELLNEVYDALEQETLKTIHGLEAQLQLLKNRNAHVQRLSRASRTVLEMVEDILLMPRLERKDVQQLVQRITVYENRVEVKLRADIDALMNLMPGQALELAPESVELLTSYGDT